MGENVESSVAEFVSQTFTDSSVAHVLLKITDNSVEEAVKLFHSISTDEKETPLVHRVPQFTSTAGGSCDPEERRLNRYHRGFSFCSPEHLITTLHEKIKKDFEPSLAEDVPRELFYLPDLLNLEPEVLSFLFDNLIDVQTLERLEGSHQLNWWAIKEPRNRLYPVITRGDGNCLMHAASLGIYGVHDKQLTLRRSTHKLLPQLPSLRRRWQHEMELRFREFGFKIELTEEQWSSEWEEILTMSSPAPLRKPSESESSSPGEAGNDSDYNSMDSLNKVKYRSLEDFHVFVLANVLYRPIIVVAMSHLYSQDNQDLLAPIYFGGIYLPLERDPRQCFQTPLILAYDSSHFCPLLPMNNGDPFIPLVDCMLAPLPLRYATDPDVPSPPDTSDNAELISRYLPISKTTILTKQLNIKAEFEHVDIVLCEERPQYQQDMLTNYFTMATEGNNTETPEQLESKMYLICKFLSTIPQHPKHENVYRLSSVTATGTGSDTLRKRIASEESSSTVITSATSTIKSTKSNASSLKAFKKCFHRRFASTSNIESKKSPPCLELQKKCSSVGSLPDTIAERKSVKRTIIRRLSRKEVRRNPNFCMVSCFGLKTGATAD